LAANPHDKTTVELGVDRKYVGELVREKNLLCKNRAGLANRQKAQEIYGKG
jgi:hypothetical protein